MRRSGWRNTYDKDREARSPGQKRSAADAEKEPVKALWTMTDKPKYGEGGWNMVGR